MSGAGLPSGSVADGSVTLAKMADLAQDKFIGRTTASTGVPETATITAAARTVLDDATVAAMLATLGGLALAGGTMTGNLAMDTKDISTDTTTGTKIGTGATQKFGFFGTTPAVQQALVALLTDSTGGTPGATLGPCGDTSASDQSALINNNFASLNVKMNAISAILKVLGLEASA